MRNWNSSANTDRVSNMKAESSSTSPNPLSEHSPATASSSKIDMVFRFWTPASADAKSRQGHEIATRYPGVLALIEDAAAARRGVLLTANEPLHVSGLKEPADALVVSRQIQHGMLGYRGKAGAPPVVVSIAIDYSGQAASATATGPGVDAINQGEQASTLGTLVSGEANYGQEISHDLMTLLTLAKPAQILITHDLWQHSGTLKSLPLKTFPGRSGVYEYLWTAEEKLDLLQSEPQLTLSALPAVISTAGGKDSANLVSTPAATAAISELTPERVQSAKPARQREAFSLSRPVLVGGIALAAVILVVVVGIIVFRGHSSQPAARNTPASVKNSPTVTNSQAAFPASPPAASAPVAPGDKLPSASPKAEKKTGAKPSTPVRVVGEKPAEQTQPCSLTGDIAKYVGLGERHRERGDYSGAIRIFRQVLDCDPGNVQAQQDLARAIQGEKSEQ